MRAGGISRYLSLRNLAQATQNVKQDREGFGDDEQVANSQKWVP